MRKKYALIGASSRAIGMYAQPIYYTYCDKIEIAGIFDINPLRIESFKKIAGIEAKSYTDCDEMLRDSKADTVVITTVDAWHWHYIIKAMNAGIDVISEKPLAINSEQCKAILETQRKTNINLTVIFNLRFTPYATAIKNAIIDGYIGEVYSINFEDYLDTSHGADYFRRWHRYKRNSGGLLIHKSTHHFDLANWWIDSIPVNVMAYGSQRFYGSSGQIRGERCLTCDHKNVCGYYIDIKANDILKKLYLDCESTDGYHRDGCVFSESIDIEDTMSVNVLYDNNAMLTYSLNAHSPYEGYKITINGSAGRLEAAEYQTGSRSCEADNIIDIFKRDGSKISFAIPKADDHGGGDARLQKVLFGESTADLPDQKANAIAGAASMLIGAAANRSIAEEKNIKIKDLVDLNNYK